MIDMTPDGSYQSFSQGAKDAGGVHLDQTVSPANSEVNTATADHEKLMRLLDLPRTLMGGTIAMRAAGLKYLPKEPLEPGAAYDSRLARTFLFNAFRKTVKDMTGKVFQREVTLEDDVPPELVTFAEDIDLAGRHLNVFARDIFFDGMQSGINYILVEMPPKVTRDDGKPATLQDEQAAGNRPYLVHIKAEDLIGIKSAVINGVVTLTQARIRETETIDVGPFAEAVVQQIRVLEPGIWQKWRQELKDGKPTDKWVLFDQGVTSLPVIPLVPVYINRCGFFRGEPPLEDLAQLNCAHWQSNSDQRNILHVARVPILYGAGFGDDATIAIGPNSITRSSIVDAKLTYVEHSGAAIGSGADDLKSLELQMQTQGLQLLVNAPGQTATGEIRDDTKENSPLAMMAMALGDALEAAFGFMAQFRGLASGGSVDVNTDFGIGSGTGIDLTTLTTGMTAGKLSMQTWWDELKRRDILKDSFDPEVEQQRLDDEQSKLLDNQNAMMNLGDGPPTKTAPPTKGAKEPVGGPGGRDPAEVVAGFPPSNDAGSR